MGTEAIAGDKLRLFFFPYVTSGHFFPMLNMATLLSSSHPSSLSSTIITTPSNSHLIPTSPNLTATVLPIPSSSLPSGWDSVTSPSDFHSLQASLPLLHQPLLNLLTSHRPHCLVSDMFLPWTAEVAAELNIPRIVFHGMSSFTLSVIASIKKHRPHDSVEGDHDSFVVPGLPHPVYMTRSQLPGPLRVSTRFNSILDRMDESEARSFGVLVNSFHGLEPEFAEHYKTSLGGRAWLVGPVSPCAVNEHSSGHLAWLESKKPGSVLYVCFGSQARFTASQLGELATGLMASKHHFIWVVRKDSPEIWLERENGLMNTQGLVIRGWAPQVQILSHGSVGGFLTHCGWNSVLEGVSAGKPMVTWPVFGDQPFNEKLIVDELKIGVRVGVEIGENEAEEVAARVVKGEDIATAVERVMADGEEAAAMRRRAKELGEEARAAVREGGSSWMDMNRLIKDLMSLNKIR